MGIRAEELKSSLKTVMKTKGRTYADLAAHLEVSLPTVKRILGPEELTLGRLLEICDWLGISLSDLETLAGLESSQSAGLFTEEQDRFLAKNPAYLTYLAHLYVQETPASLAKTYGLTAKSTELYLLRLEKLGLLHRDGKGRVRLAHRAFPQMSKDGLLIRSQYRQLIEKFSGFFLRHFSRSLGGEKDRGPTWMSMFSSRLSRKTARDWQNRYQELQRELVRQSGLEDKLDVIEDECYFVVSHLHAALEPADPEVAGLKETLGRIVNL